VVAVAVLTLFFQRMVELVVVVLVGIAVRSLVNQLVVVGL
jgi:hypothetical protein